MEALLALSAGAMNKFPSNVPSVFMQAQHSKIICRAIKSANRRTNGLRTDGLCEIGLGRDERSFVYALTLVDVRFRLQVYASSRFPSSRYRLISSAFQWPTLRSSSRVISSRTCAHLCRWIISLTTLDVVWYSGRVTQEKTRGFGSKIKSSNDAS